MHIYLFIIIINKLLCVYLFINVLYIIYRSKKIYLISIHLFRYLLSIHLLRYLLSIHLLKYLYSYLSIYLCSIYLHGCCFYTNLPKMFKLYVFSIIIKFFMFTFFIGRVRDRVLKEFYIFFIHTNHCKIYIDSFMKYFI